MMFLGRAFSNQGPSPGPVESKPTTQNKHTAPALQLPLAMVSCALIQWLNVGYIYCRVQGDLAGEIEIYLEGTP